MNVSEEDVDALFCSGLCSTLITDIRTTGYSDLDLHFTASISDNDASMMLEPDTSIQLPGRTRGKDFLEQPLSLRIIDKGNQAAFDLKNLNSSNYFLAFYSSKAKHHTILLKDFSHKIFTQIELHIKNNTKIDDGFIIGNLENECLKIFKCEYERLYNENHHDYKQTKQDFLKILKNVNHILQTYEKAISTRYKKDFSLKVIQAILNLLCKIYYLFCVMTTHKSLMRNINKKLANKNFEQRAYAFILNNYDFKKLTTIGVAGKTINRFFKEKLENLEPTITNNHKEFIVNGELDREKIIKIFAVNINGLFLNKEARNIFSMIEKLGPDHLQVILNSTDNINAKKMLEFLKEFKACKNIEDLEKFISKNIEKLENIMDSKFIKIFEKIEDVFKDLIDTHCYYYNISDKGEAYGSNKASFISNDINLFPKIDSSKHGMIGNIAYKMQYTLGLTDALPLIGKVNIHNEKEKIANMKQTSSEVIEKFASGLNNKKNKNNNHMHEIGKRLAGLKPLTKEEILDPTLTKFNNIQELDFTNLKNNPRSKG